MQVLYGLVEGNIPRMFFEVLNGIEIPICELKPLSGLIENAALDSLPNLVQGAGWLSAGLGAGSRNRGSDFCTDW